MALKPLSLRPGLYTINTDRGAEGRWKDADHVRWWQALPEKIGGWERVISTSDFVGVARGVADWVSLAFEKIIGLGTHLKLYIWSGGAFTDITPLRDSGHARREPDHDDQRLGGREHRAHRARRTAGRLRPLQRRDRGGRHHGERRIHGDERRRCRQLHDHALEVASSGATGGGAAVAYEYEIHVGAVDSVGGRGWGASSWGSSTWGTARSITTILNWARTWSLDTWGEDLIANPRGAGIYVYDTSAGGRASVISGAPTTARAIYVSTENRILVALGAHDGSVDNPLLIRWCSAEDYTDWTPSDTNTAGDKQLDAGAELSVR
jgi:hypothetical protein